MSEMLGCGWDDEAMAQAMTSEGGEPLEGDVQAHVSECLQCRSELAMFSAAEERIRRDLSEGGASGDVDAAVVAWQREGHSKPSRMRLWVPGLALAAAMVWMLAVVPGEEGALGPTGPDEVSDAPLVALSPMEGLTAEERQEVEEVLAQVSSSHGEMEAGEWDSFEEDGFWDVADDVEAQDLEGLERALDALVEG